MDSGAYDHTLSQPTIIRWGLGDALGIYVAGVIGALVLAVIGAGISHDVAGKPASALTTALSFFGQYTVWIVGMVYISRKKGRGTLLQDFGFVAHARDAWGLVVGVALEVALGLMVYPIISLAHHEKQTVVEDLKNSSGAKLTVIIIAAGLLAPITEELFFRGLLLRALRRRWSPEVAIGASALIFALAHPLLDPQLGTFALVPALFALGAVSGIAATMTGELSFSIALHIGFNLLTVATLGVVILR
jgi:membrane protease YdiL (CAAX protease family)